MDAIADFIYRFTAYERLEVLFELLLIGVVVYWIVSFLEGTRGERLFRGVIFILVVGSLLLYFVVERFNLTRIDFLFNKFLIAVLVIAVIAFQPEIRRALIRIGQSRFLTSSPQQLSRSVEEIVGAVIQLAATKTGAIIVIAQEVGLGEFIDTGVRLDAKVTAELIKTIFNPGTALHDMAVIIQGDRLLAARVQLPLAEMGSLKGAQLGSRHRAAIGVTNSTDALVIVVSEETGIISLAISGNLIRNISEPQLRRHLTTAVVDTTPLIERHRGSRKTRSTDKVI